MTKGSFGCIVRKELAEEGYMIIIRFTGGAGELASRISSVCYRILEEFEDNLFYIVAVAVAIAGTMYVLASMPLPPHWTRFP
ncbi:MAG: hypothetical protein EXS69_00550 [Candidatus Zambryskibacteria bacterium]|nr:hypothetical protein [Candidatus Zambryskibacteria bacterium]